MSDEDDDARAERIINAGPLFGSKHMSDEDDDDKVMHADPIFDAQYMGREQESSQKEDFKTTNLKWLNQTLSEIRSDAFNTQQLSDEAARNRLRDDEFLRVFPLIQAALAAPHQLNGEIRQKSDEILSIAKKLFNDNEIYKSWKDDINRRKQKFRRQHYEDDNYTPDTIPDGSWFSNNNKGSPISSYAVSSARNVEVACNRLPAKLWYDPFDCTFRIEYEGHLKTINSAKQVRSHLLVPIANKFGYEARRDHFEDFIEALKNDERRHYDTLIHYYNSFEAQYDPDFKCIDENVSILDTDNDEYSREGIRSLLLGSVQRAYFPGCELQRIITLIADENVGKTTFIKMKAGNLDWEPGKGISHIRWYSNKNIINPQMSDRDRQSACIGINTFEFDERRGQRAIETEHFRSFITSVYDDFRIWQGMEPVRVLRRWDLIGSTNKGDYNTERFIRRDWGLDVSIHGKRIDLPKFKDLYPKIIAWAVHHVKSGMSAIPDYSLYEKAKIRQRNRIRRTDTMDFLEPVWAFAHLYGSLLTSEADAYRVQAKYHISYKDEINEAKILKRTYLVDQTGLSNFASDYKRFYNRSGNTDKTAIKNDILNVQVRPIVSENDVNSDLSFMWQSNMDQVVWSGFLKRAMRGYALVIEGENIGRMEQYAMKVLEHELQFITTIAHARRDDSKYKEDK